MRRIRIQLRAELMLLVRNGEQLLLTLIIPVLLLGFFGSRGGGCSTGAGATLQEAI